MKFRNYKYLTASTGIANQLTAAANQIHFINLSSANVGTSIKAETKAFVFRGVDISLKCTLRSDNLNTRCQTLQASVNINKYSLLGCIDRRKLLLLKNMTTHLMFNGEIRPKCGCPQHHQKHSISAQTPHVKCEVQWWRGDDSDLFCSHWTRVPYSYGINNALLSIPNFSLKCETICPIDKTESCNKKVIPSNSKSTNEWLKKKRITVSQSRPQPT